jgi:hypothetical protein
VEWDTYLRRGDGWNLWIERVSDMLWELWYQSAHDGNRFLGRAKSPLACVALITPDRFARAGIEPSLEVFSTTGTSWVRSLHLVL